MPTPIPDDLVRGDLLKIVWIDIFEDSTGDPDKAALAQRTSYGLFWSRAESYGLPCVVTTTTLDDVAPGQGRCNGFCIYPEAVVMEMKVVKRARRPRARKVAAVVP